MPILDVEVVVEDGETLKPGLAQELADIAGKALGTPAGRTWVKLRALPRERYAESGGSTPKNIKPVFVSVLKSKKPPLEILQKEIREITQGFARACGRPANNVHILYLPEATGRAAFGGELLT